MRHPIKFDEVFAAGIARLPKRAYPLMDYASRLGGSVFISATLLFVLVWALITRDTSLLIFGLLVALFTPLAEILKLLTRRSRPETLYVKNMKFKTYSFPSGHAYVSCLTAGFLATLSIVYLDSPLNWIAASCFLAFSILVGVSRVYLGAHFPSDIVAGWLLGLFALYIISVLGGAATV